MAPLTALARAATHRTAPALLLLLLAFNVYIDTVSSSPVDDALVETRELTMVTPLDIDETSIAAGVEHSCAIYTKSYNDVGGRVLCWGLNNGGQSSPPPGQFIQVSTGRLHTCAVRIDETVECWGAGAPTHRPDGLFEQVSSGDFHSCGVLKDKSLQCWGAVGRATPPTGKFAQVSCGRDFTCALSIDGAVTCWGENSRGQLDAPTGTTFKQISASPGSFVCGVTAENDIACWGDNHRGQCAPPADAKYTLVSTSRLGACALKVDKTVACWGMRSGVTSAPRDVKFDELTLGWNHGCGIRFDDGGVQCWGHGANHRLDIPAVLQY